MTKNAVLENQKIFAVAPMMDWTDRHCRYFHRLLSRNALLYSEMVVADAVMFGDVEMLLANHDVGGPVALQLGGSDPVKLAQACKIAVEFGYCEINLNVGCPSDRVQSGVFGAVLMREPELVGRCIGAMKNAVDIPVTVKCRIGVDDQDIEIALDELAKNVWTNGCDGLWVHARKAWLEGLSPKENRMVPPLDYGRVERLKQNNPERFIGLNGGLETLGACLDQLDHFDGAMVGRAAYQRPAMLRDVDRCIYGIENPSISYTHLCEALCAYSEKHLLSGGKMRHITRHILGLFHGQPGARQYRRILSVEVNNKGSGPRIIQQAFDAVSIEVDIKAA